MVSTSIWKVAEMALRDPALDLKPSSARRWGFLDFWRYGGFADQSTDQKITDRALV
jgi:hypothetical protein